MKPNDEWQFSTFGSEYEYLIRHILPFQEVFFLCTKCQIDVSRSKNEFFLDKDDKGQCDLQINLFENCSKCKAYVRAKFRIKPFCLFATPLRNQKNIPDIDKISIIDIPKTLNIDNTVYNFFCCSYSDFYNEIEHFKCIFYLNNQFYLVDDLANKSLQKKIKTNVPISNCLYYIA